ncbi:hypothetical protein RBH94_08395 [Aestuariibaculum sp. YM273]|uniref:hypothetical protein n=1 Tax=Aestuariibaculum sp. YM273 TaxID=3070659 RepID=UPI0027DBE7C2|nr:hypothetical protein [Aestuariibaculum sp. YM273]WMI64089.1 hypothetical protein RBH94_08395 [Aestuariibaculum sp. YM273]
MYNNKYKDNFSLFLTAICAVLSLVESVPHIWLYGIPVLTAERPQWNTLKAS